MSMFWRDDLKYLFLDMGEKAIHVKSNEEILVLFNGRADDIEYGGFDISSVDYSCSVLNDDIKEFNIKQKDVIKVVGEYDEFEFYQIRKIDYNRSGTSKLYLYKMDDENDSEEDEG